ncbi:hypothetical protein Leryth_020849 [Lithospermum erythrorhizon]|nr:hypothetical protein Leryth_020849 [Lithospermum erythrorhizon]
MSARLCLDFIKILVFLGVLLRLIKTFVAGSNFCMQSSSSVSMRSRPIRTRTGVKCFGGYHIKRLDLFLCSRTPLT